MIKSLFSCFLLFTILCAQGAKAQISINSPSDGATFKPGDQFTVEVSAPVGSSVILGGGDYHISISPLKIYQAPYDFTVTLPENIPAGIYPITAMFSPASLKNSDNYLATAQIKINVEPTVTNEANLSVSPGSMRFTYEGQSKYVVVKIIQNGIEQGVNSSTQLSAVSADPSIVSVVGSTQLVAGSTAGETSVTFTLGMASVVLPVKNTATGIQGDFNADSKIDKDDLNILRAASGKLVNNPNDARDQNHDGKITNEDVDRLEGLCTFAKCATYKEE
jgi:hypothetical protein